MPSIRLHGTSMVEYIYGDKYNKPARIIESVYDMRWRLAPNGTIFRLAESKGRSMTNIDTNIQEIMLCSNVDVDSIGIDKCLTTYMDTKYKNILCSNGTPRHIDRAMLPPDDVNMLNLTAFKRYRDHWIRLMGYIFPYIGFIGKDDEGTSDMVRLYIPEKIHEIVLEQINETLMKIYSMYKSKGTNSSDLVPEPDIRKVGASCLMVTYRGRRGGISKETPIFDRWVRFARILYRRGAIAFGSNCVPTGILTGTSNLQSQFMVAMCAVSCLYRGERSGGCGVFYDNRRSMIISLKLLFDQLGLSYTLVEGKKDGKYNGSIYTCREFPESMSDIYRKDKIYLGYPNPKLDDIGPDLFDITIDADSILVDGIRVPLFD